MPDNTGLLLSVLTGATCGFACWEAREDVCRCSCGGKNHGVLRHAGAVQPQRTAKIDGIPYRLEAVGARAEVGAVADGVNRAFGYRSIERPIRYEGLDGVRWIQYRYTWKDTDSGAPARLKYATADQIKRWPELSAWRGLDRFELYQAAPSLVWVRIEMPAHPTQPLVDEFGNVITEDGHERHN